MDANNTQKILSPLPSLFNGSYNNNSTFDDISINNEYDEPIVAVQHPIIVQCQPTEEIEILRDDADKTFIQLTSSSSLVLENQNENQRENHNGNPIENQIEFNSIDLNNHQNEENEKISKIKKKTKKITEKLKKSPIDIFRDIQKERRMKGESYIGYTRSRKFKITNKNTPRPPRIIGPACKSKFCETTKRQCNEITQEMRDKLFKNFWSNMNWEERKSYVVNNVKLIEPKRRQIDKNLSRRGATLIYKLIFDDNNNSNQNYQEYIVCKKNFLSTLALREFSVRDWVMKHYQKNFNNKNSLQEISNTDDDDVVKEINNQKKTIKKTKKLNKNIKKSKYEENNNKKLKKNTNNNDDDNEKLTKLKKIKKKQRKIEKPISDGLCKSKFCIKTSTRQCDYITNDMKKTIFKEFWFDMTNEQRENYILKNVKTIEPKSRHSIMKKSRRNATLIYQFIYNNKEYVVCKQFFLSTLRLNEHFIRNLLNDKKDKNTKLNNLKSDNGNNQENLEFKQKNLIQKNQKYATVVDCLNESSTIENQTIEEDELLKFYEETNLTLDIAAKNN